MGEDMCAIVLNGAPGVASGQEWLRVKAKAIEQYGMLEDGDLMCVFTLPEGASEPRRDHGKIILHPGDRLEVAYGTK